MTRARACSFSASFLIISAPSSGRKSQQRRSTRFAAFVVNNNSAQICGTLTRLGQQSAPPTLVRAIRSTWATSLHAFNVHVHVYQQQQLLSWAFMGLFNISITILFCSSATAAQYGFQSAAPSVYRFQRQQHLCFVIQHHQHLCFIIHFHQHICLDVHRQQHLCSVFNGSSIVSVTLYTHPHTRYCAASESFFQKHSMFHVCIHHRQQYWFSSITIQYPFRKQRRSISVSVVEVITFVNRSAGCRRDATWRSSTTPFCNNSRTWCIFKLICLLCADT